MWKFKKILSDTFFCQSQQNSKKLFKRQPSHWAHVYFRYISMQVELYKCYKDVNYCISRPVLLFICCIMQFASLVVIHGVWDALERAHGERGSCKQEYSHSRFSTQGKFGLRRARYNEKRSSLSPNRQIYIPHLNANLNLAMGDKFTTAKLIIKCNKNTFFPFIP